ncbi:tyrosine--tRNA ligase [Anaplasma bovis]|uniref:tyrosine--tRNA ligase n=1 Tax=Anaplasma bovis TaxID=186733 RepID=UPI002FF22AED
MRFRSDFLGALSARGYLSNCTDPEALDNLMASERVVAYIGFDCTAASLHIGSLVQIMVLRYLIKHGHKPIVLLGGATTKVGDPSGKEKTRAVISDADIDLNKKGILKVISKFFSSDDKVHIVDNVEWLGELKYLDFLREVGSKFAVGAMLGLDSVKSRLSREQNLSFLEFNYVLLQSYDFVELYKRYGCVLQIGGSDQWGNIVNGIDLARKMGCPQLYGLTTNLLLTSTGAKMGKTDKGAVWLDGELLSPEDYWQYFRNVPDEDVGRLLRLFTELSIDEIEKLEALKDEDINEAKKILATEAVRVCHGEEIAQEITQRMSNVFELGDDSLLKSIMCDKELLQRGISISELLHVMGLQESIGAGRRLIRGRGCKVNGAVVEDENMVISHKDFNESGFMTIFCGKKRRAKIVLRS